MGQQHKRTKALSAKIKLVEEYVREYQYALRALLAQLPSEAESPLYPSITAIGWCDIWPCKDAAVVLTYINESKDIKVRIKSTLSKTVDEFMKEGEAFLYFDKFGRPFPIGRPVIGLTDPSNHSFDYSNIGIDFGEISFSDEPIVTETTKVFRPKFQRLSIYGWNVIPSQPDQQALRDFRAAYATRNVLGFIPEWLPQQEIGRLTLARSEQILTEFNALLDNAENEEDIQIYLNKHPELIYPDYIDCFPKFKLGDDFITDYVFIVQGSQGLEHVFVEIEKTKKGIFTKSGQFSANFTQAKDQILDWDSWLIKNHAYISSKLSKLHKPLFHLVMGRNSEITDLQRSKIQAEFTGTTRRFSTYDDLSSRFQQIAQRISQSRE
jgi:hypothetical protein